MLYPENEAHFVSLSEDIRLQDMAKRYFYKLSLLILSILGCIVSLTLSAKGQSPAVRPKILVETSKGKFVLELFNETPQHRDAFLRLVREGQYEGTLFHRVIKGFMIQGGNLQSKGLKPTDELPEDSTSGTIAAEFRPDLYVHTRGMLAAARQGDEINPERRSSASQFYIVTGKYYTALDLRDESAKHGIKYTAEQREAYMTQGGAAHLDGTYTIFGRLLEGYATVDKIQRVDTNDEDRPLKNVIIKRMTLLP